MAQIDRSNLTSRGMIPNGIYTALIKKVDNAASSGKGTPQTKLHLEIVAPAVKEFAGVQYEVAGIDTDKERNLCITMWWTDKATARSIETLADLGLPEAQTADTTEQLQEAALKLERNFIEVVVASKERIKRENPLPGQKSWEAKEMRDEAGQIVTDGWEVIKVTPRRGTLRNADGVTPF